jgi:hypothetical protein
MIARALMLTVVTVSFTLPALAQRVEPVAARRASADSGSLRLSNEVFRSLGQDVTRGMKYGAIAGAVLSGITVIAIRSSGCSAGEAPCSHLGNGQTAAVIGAGTVAGTLVGAILGYTYHRVSILIMSQLSSPFDPARSGYLGSVAWSRDIAACEWAQRRCD